MIERADALLIVMKILPSSKRRSATGMASMRERNAYCPCKPVSRSCLNKLATDIVEQDLGLHRACSSLTPTEAEQRKSVFWSLYSLEISLASDLGRPTSVPEDEIDNIPEEAPTGSSAGTADTMQVLILSNTTDDILIGLFSFSGASTGYLHLIRAHRLTAQVLRGNSMHLRVEASSKRRSMTAIQQRQLDAGTRLQQWYENMPNALQKNEDQLSPTERMYKYISKFRSASLLG